MCSKPASRQKRVRYGARLRPIVSGISTSGNMETLSAQGDAPSGSVISSVMTPSEAITYQVVTEGKLTRLEEMMEIGPDVLRGELIGGSPIGRPPVVLG